MRLYLKLAAFVLVFIGIQAGVTTHEPHVRRAVFTLRCGFAFATHNQQMIDQLTDEVQRSPIEWTRAGP